MAADEDIPTTITSSFPANIPVGPVAKARAHQLKYQVFSFLQSPSKVYEHMMLLKWDTFILLQNEGSMDGRDAAWSKRKHEEEGVCARRSSYSGQGPDIRRTGHPARIGIPAT